MPTLIVTLPNDNTNTNQLPERPEFAKARRHRHSCQCHTRICVRPHSFQLIESGPKLLYLNTTQRGYPKGLRAGADPRKPLVAIDEHFETIDCRGIASPLQSIEVRRIRPFRRHPKLKPNRCVRAVRQVWGCGDQRSRDVQLDIRKWQIREAERQRTVKLTAADWLDHPDRYLLELGGRAQYNNSSK